MNRILEFIEDRNGALRSLDEQRIRDYAAKYGEVMSSDPVVFWGSVHKARLEIVSFTEAEHAVSRKWLKANGFKTRMSGEPL